MTEVNPYAAPVATSDPPEWIDLPEETELVDQAKKLVRWPATLMILQGTILSLLYFCVFAIDIYHRGLLQLMSPSIIFNIISLLGPLLVVCGVKLYRLESRSLSILGAILSVVLYLPFGWIIFISTLIAINRDPVRLAFRKYQKST